MAYIFLTDGDIEVSLQSHLITANSADAPALIFEKIEKSQIDFISAMLNSRYDMAVAFAQVDDERNGVLLEILIKLVVYKFIKRNAARKVPEDAKDDYKWAMEQLEKIQAGKYYPGLPQYEDENGDTALKPIYANNTKPENYI